MSKQQSKRRRKRYQPGSAYAGDVRPTGVLGFLSGANMVKIIFISMALALVGGGAAVIFGSGALRGGSSSSLSQDNFVVPGDEDVSAADDTTTDDALGVRQYVAPPALTIDPDKRYVATIKTEGGDIEVELLAAQVPETVNNFVFLAQDGFYDGLAFHFVVDGFSAQAGDPACTAESSAGGCDGGPGYSLAQENPDSFERGTLGMVNGSQFFIALTGSEQFSQFTPFGEVISGLDLADALTRGTAIESIEIEEL